MNSRLEESIFIDQDMTPMRFWWRIVI